MAYLEREKAEELIDSVLMMALHMLMNQAPLVVISHILSDLSVDIQMQTFHGAQPVNAMRALRDALRLAGSGKDGDLRVFLQKYQWRNEYSEFSLEPPKVIIQRPENWQELAAPYICGWSRGMRKEEQERIYNEILASWE